MEVSNLKLNATRQVNSTSLLTLKKPLEELEQANPINIEQVKVSDNNVSDTVSLNDRLEKSDKESHVNDKLLFEVLGEANKKLSLFDHGLQFNIHQDTNRTFVRIMDRKNEEVLKEIPPEQYLDLVANIWSMVGIIVDKKI
ncbi:MAG: flagellar protein FlaG [Bacillota bacterium]|nr:flagellar protein FlaG [Bacillota bacterium]